MKRGHPLSRSAQAAIVASNLATLGALRLARRMIRDAGCSEVDVFGGARHRAPVRVRHRIWTILRHTLDLSYPKIARLWCQRDHTTVMAAIKKREAELDLEATDAELAQLRLAGMLSPFAKPSQRSKEPLSPCEP